MSSNKAISSTLFICAKPLLNQSPVAVIITRSDHSPWLAHWTVHRSLKEILYKTQGFPSSYVTLMPPPVDSETGRRAHLAKLREGHFFFLFFQKLSDFFSVIFFSQIFGYFLTFYNFLSFFLDFWGIFSFIFFNFFAGFSTLFWFFEVFDFRIFLLFWFFFGLFWFFSKSLWLQGDDGLNHDISDLTLSGLSW